MQPLSITVVGAGITGLWQALTLARRGHRVRLIERSAEPFAQAASAYAGAMLAPYCEVEAAELVVRDLGLRSLAIWRATYPGVTVKGTLVVAGTRDRADLVRFARMTEGYDKLDAEQVHGLEPGLEGRFAAGLYYAQEGHMAPAHAMAFLLDAARRAGVEVAFGTPWTGERRPATRPSSTAAGSARATSFPICAAYAASASSCARARSACSAPCGSCTRAIRSTSCPGATASSWWAPA